MFSGALAAIAFKKGIAIKERHSGKKTRQNIDGHKSVSPASSAPTSLAQVREYIEWLLMLISFICWPSTLNGYSQHSTELVSYSNDYSPIESFHRRLTIRTRSERLRL